MSRFLGAFSSICLAVMTIAIGWEAHSYCFTIERSVGLAIVLGILPSIAAGIGAALVHAVRPRRVLDHRSIAAKGPVIVGLIAGILAVVATGAIMLISPASTYSGAAFPLTSGACAIMVVRVFGGRRSPGHCLHCDYDIGGSLDFGRCPECGTELRSAPLPRRQMTMVQGD